MSNNRSNVAVIRIKPHQYIHVLNNNTNVTRVVTGPQTFTREDHELIVAGPLPMVMIPPRSFCIIQNPHVKDEEGPVFDEHGQIQLVYGDEEVRLESPDPFPLYPGEALLGKVTPLQVVQPNMALRLKAKRNIKDKKAGEEWLFEGPATYIPSVSVEVLEIVKAFIIKQNQALHLRAKRDCVDSEGHKRICGEHWIYRKPGAYLPGVYEEPMETINAYILTEKKALQLEAIDTFTDIRDVKRLAGEQWLVTIDDAESHIPDVYERVVGEVPVTTLSSLQYCVVVNPMKKGKNQWGKRELRKGETSFFLQPGETLESGIQNVHVLDSQEALLLRAIETFTDADGTVHSPGNKWMIFGPCDYVPPVHVSIVERRSTIPLDENEGIYVRNMKNGKVQAIVGKSYMLSAEEELWKKEVSPQVEELLMKHNSGTVSKSSTRDPTRMITYRAPHNSAIQVYDYKSRTSRVAFGPELVSLGPDEEFTVKSLSGGVPKQPHAIKSLALLLGPDFMTDVVVVETSDHARLSLKLSYNWHFEVDRKNPSKLFSVPDFVGDSCKAIASRVRGVVAQNTFDNFHKGSAQIIRSAVFGVDDSGEAKNRFIFSQNGLVITNIDIQSVEPVDSRTRDALQKSVQLAIEITTKSQEATARHEAERREQEARGRLERQKIEDECEAERSRVDLINLQSQSAIVEATGQATAEARARAEAAAIEARAAVKQAELNAEAEAHKHNAQLERQKHKQETDLSHKEALNSLEIHKAKDLASIEVKKFKDIISAVGPDTIEAIATSNSTTQVKLLESLGLTSHMITDGNNPINLFSTAYGLISEGN